MKVNLPVTVLVDALDQLAHRAIVVLHAEPLQR